jgi:4-amino-4-deoxy-L-arabinose transferase-like glycosyltransferase
VTAVGVGLLARVLLSRLLPTHWDVGHYLYWGQQVLDGHVPFRDFFARHPVYIYLVALAMTVFGSTVFAVAAIAITASLATVVLVYRIAAELFDAATGRLAAAIYAVAPTVLFYSTVPDERSLALLCVTAAVYLLLLAVKRGRSRYLVGVGVVLGLAIYVYKGVAVYLLTAPVLLLALQLRARGGWAAVKTTATQLLAVIVGATVAVAPLFAYYLSMMELPWVLYSVLGVGGQQESVGHFVLAERASLPFRLRILHVAMREWFYLVLPTFLFVGGYLAFRLRRRPAFSRALLVLLLVTLYAGMLVGASFAPQDSYGAYEPVAAYSGSLLLLSVVLGALTPHLFARLQGRPPFATGWEVPHAVALYWLLTAVLTVSLYGMPLVNYSYWLAPVMVLATAVVLRTLSRDTASAATARDPRRRQHRVVLLFTGLLLASSVSTAGMLWTTPMTWRNQPLATLHRVAAYLAEHTEPADEILTNNPAVALFADRRVALDMMPMLLYGKVGPQPFDPLPYDPYGLIPDVGEVVAHLETGAVPYLVDTAYLFEVIVLHPAWNRTVAALYAWETTIDGVALYRLKGG